MSDTPNANTEWSAPVADYKLVLGAYPEMLVCEVVAALVEGWQPQGGPFVIERTNEYAQALVRRQRVSMPD